MNKTGLFGFPLEENYSENVQEKEEGSRSSEEEPEKEEKEEQEEEEESSSSEEEEEKMDDDEPDPSKPLREKGDEDLKDTFPKEVQRFLDRGKTQDYAEIAAISMPYYL